MPLASVKTHRPRLKVVCGADTPGVNVRTGMEEKLKILVKPSAMTPAIANQNFRVYCRGC